jgi:hypothetical protein
LPADPGLRALRAAAEDGLAATLWRAGLTPPFEEVVTLRYHPGRRCAFALRAGGHRLVAKAYRRDVADVARLLTSLGHHGLASGRAPSATPLVAYARELRLLVTHRLDGLAGRELLAHGARVGALAAAWLPRQWGLGLEEGRPCGPREQLRRVHVHAAAVHAAARNLAAPTAALLVELEETLPPDDTAVLCHGSFSVNHIVDLGDGPGVLDWDEFCQGPPESDAANFLSTLARVATAGPVFALQAAAAEHAFRERIAGAVDARSLAWHEAATLLRGARHLCVRQPEAWRARASELLSLARARLRASR